MKLRLTILALAVMFGAGVLTGKQFAPPPKIVTKTLIVETHVPVTLPLPKGKRTQRAIDTLAATINERDLRRFTP